MKDLIARLEAAEVGGRELDREVWRVLFDVQRMPKPGLFTTSLDAALALMGRVLPDWDWQITKGADEMALVSIAPTCKVCGPEACAPTPALALCVAILRAKLAEEPTKG